MVNINESKFSEICREYGKATVGRICKNIEILQKDLDKNSPEYKVLQIAKNLHRETVYENLRDLELTVRFASEGKVYIKHEIYTKPPTV